MAKLFKVGAMNPITLNPSNGKTFTLKELQKVVGGYVEVIFARPWYPKELQGKCIICDEEGV